MNKEISILGILILAFLLSGCTSEADFDLNETKIDNIPAVKEEAAVVAVEKEETSVVKKAVEAVAKVTEPIRETVANIANMNQDDESDLPKSLDLKAPFVSQAPTGDWGLPYQEACEEAALISAAKYFKGEKEVSESVANTEILKLVEWEKKMFGAYTDTTLDESKKMAEEYFGLKAEIRDDVSIDSIKKALADNSIVIVPTAGRELNGPYYSGLGPIFHYLVIRGYDGKYFITNDPGTRTKGNGFKFKQDVIMNAIHDLPPDKNGSPIRMYESNLSDSEKAVKILEGQKRILLISK
ncbi:C39 family peptidase [Patescibacteria group bacterium]|nr:C39 family peptidase [Patescibacteria group bacterium]